MANEINSQSRPQGQAQPAGTTVRPAVAGGARGKTVIADGVVAKIAGIAVREVEGVHTLGGGAARAVGAIRDAMGNSDLSQGVSVEVGEKQVAADITLVADYPYSLQKIADGVRVAVTRVIEELVGLEVAEINVTINDVYVPSEDNDSDEGVRVQ